MTAAGDNDHVPVSFATTQWTRVLAAKGNSTESRQVLRELCESWYAPVHAFVRHTCRGRDDARDLTHAFFAKLLEGHAFSHLERGRGKFRSYLLGAVKHFLADERDRTRSAKRGGGTQPQSFDPPSGHAFDCANGAVAATARDPQGFPDDAWFDREWAMALLEKSLARLESEAAGAGRAETFRQLKPWLTGDVPDVSQAEIAQTLGQSEAALKVTIHRLRKRFREIVRDEIASTVTSSEDIDSELSYLVTALSHARRS